MRCLIFTGNHRRHLSMFSEITHAFDEVMMVVMEREDMIPVPGEDLDPHDRDNFVKHFKNRDFTEKKFFGDLDFGDFDTENLVRVQIDSLHSELVLQKVKEFDADIAFVFGTGLILGNLLKALPENKINIHLGLSPWYRGAATLFWPFYFLQPQFAGVTFHQIIPAADAGEIIHQCVAALEAGDSIHDVAAKAVLKANSDLKRIIEHFKTESGFYGYPQKTSGRLWLNKDFKAKHLRINYDLFGDRMVDAYLSGSLGDEQPKLISCI